MQFISRTGRKIAKKPFSSHICNHCGSSNAYLGLEICECVNIDCPKYNLDWRYHPDSYDRLPSLEEIFDISKEQLDLYIKALADGYGYGIETWAKQCSP